MGGNVRYLKTVWLLLEKDILLEVKTREIFSSMLLFSLLTIVIFNFAFDLRGDKVGEYAPGILWVAFSFSGILGLNRSFVKEKEDDCLKGLMLAPVDRSAIYISKFLGNFIFILLVELLTLLFFIMIFNLTVEHTFYLLWIIFIATLGFAAIGTLFAAMSSYMKSREILMPLLFLPVVVPVILGAVESTGSILTGNGIDAASKWVSLILSFDGIFFAVSLMVFDYVIEE